MLYQKLKEGDKILCYKINKWKIRVNFDILTDISEHITLVQLMDTVGDVNYTVIIDGHFILASNNDK